MGEGRIGVCWLFAGHFYCREYGRKCAVKQANSICVCWFDTVRKFSSVQQMNHLGEHFSHVRRSLMGVVLVILILVALDGPLLADEGVFNRLRIQQFVIFGAALITLISTRSMVHSVAGLVATVALMAGWFIRFFPGAIT